MIAQSPLRYPGGKSKLYPLVVDIVCKNDLIGCTYREPYAGGAGLALNLLASGFVSRICLNDFDYAIYSFWHAALNHSEEFIERIKNTDLNVDEWYRKKEVWLNPDKYSSFELGFSTYYLNRTNRSGIIEGAGPIGGYNQTGNYKIDARFNKEGQIKTISFLKNLRENIEISYLDASVYVSNFIETADLIYLDPPYYIKGSKLYRNSYSHSDHVAISNIVRSSSGNWMVSYDDVAAIRQIYDWATPATLTLDYSAGRRSVGNEVIYFSPSLAWPDCLATAA